jgi:hypothetical protein
MSEITQYLLEIAHWLIQRIQKHLTGEADYEVQKVRERIPHIVPSGVNPPFAPPDAPCDKY